MLSKKELLKQIIKLDKQIEEWRDVPLNREKYNELAKVKTKRKRLKRDLYECDFCADAEFKIDKNGDEHFKKDCGRAECPYHNYFMELDEAKEKNIERKLNDFLESI